MSLQFTIGLHLLCIYSLFSLPKCIRLVGYKYFWVKHELLFFASITCTEYAILICFHPPCASFIFVIFVVTFHANNLISPSTFYCRSVVSQNGAYLVNQNSPTAQAKTANIHS